MSTAETPPLAKLESLPRPNLLASMFDAWAASRTRAYRGLSEPTEAVQRAMWSAFSAWCVRSRIDPVALPVAELVAYLQSRQGTAPASELTPRYAWRLVNLIDRVINHAASVQGRAPNRAAAELMESDLGLKHANAESKDSLPEVLMDAQDRALVAFLEASVPRDAAAGGVDLASRWQDMRNRAGVAMQRGAGLTPLEIRMLKVSSVFMDLDTTKGPWKVRAPATGSVQEHDAPVARWARPILTYWMRVRTDLGIPGEWLFPSTKSGKQWGKTAQFDAVAEVLESAGLAELKGGSYRLRHTFALRQLARPECTPDKVAGWLGIEPAEMRRYRGVMMEPVDVL